MNRRALLLAILTYLTLDLSVPAMPGAFVFEPADSAEGTQVVRGRLAAEVVALPSLTDHSSLPAPPRSDLRQRRPPRYGMAHLARSAARSLPRAACASSPLSEDPH